VKKGTVAVVTADVIGSSRYRPPDRKRLDDILRRSFAEAERRYPTTVHTRMAFRITAGDEFQWVMDDVGRAFDVLMYLRAVVASSHIEPRARFRAAIGVGGISVSRRDDPYSEDGPAFANARVGLQSLDKSRGPLRWTALITGKPRLDEAADAVLCLADYLMQGWTTAQWSAIRWSLLDFTREEIAAQLDVAHQNVTKRLHAAGWLHFQVAAKFLRGLLCELTHPDSGASDVRTDKRVRRS